MDSAYFSGRSGGEKNFSKKIFFLKLDQLCGPVAAKPLVLELLYLEVGTSVASAGTAETSFEIIKCISDVDMPARMRMGSKREIFRFFNSGYAHDRNISIFRCRASTVTGNTLIKPKYASVRQSRGSVHHDRDNVTKKSRRCRALKPLELRSWKSARRHVFGTLLCL